MYIEDLGTKKRVTLDKEEMKSLNVTYQDFFEQNEKAEDLVYDIAIRYFGWDDNDVSNTDLKYYSTNEGLILEYDRKTDTISSLPTKKSEENILLKTGSLASIFDVIKKLNINTHGSLYKTSDKKEYYMSLNKINGNNSIDVLLSEFDYIPLKVSKGYLKEHCQPIFQNKNVLEIAKKLY